MKAHKDHIRDKQMKEEKMSKRVDGCVHSAEIEEYKLDR